MLVNYQEVTSTCKTVGDFRKVFNDAFILNAKYMFGISVTVACEKFARFNGMSPNDTLIEQYHNLQGWVALEEGEYNSLIKSKGNYSKPTPPWIQQLWIFAKNVSFEACLWAMNENSKSFEILSEDENKTVHTGFVKITGGPYNDASTLTWHANLETYKGLEHREKHACRQKRERKTSENCDY